MIKNTGFRKPKRLSKREQVRAKETYAKQLAAFKLKCTEYEPMSLQELQDLYQSKKRPGGTYLQALFYVTNEKLKAQKEEAKEKLAEISEIEPVEETTKEVEQEKETVNNTTEEKKEE